MPSDLDRSGFLFNYKIVNTEPVEKRLPPVETRRFPKTTLRILAPHNFIPQGVLDSFSRKTGVEFQILHYETGKQAEQRVKNGEIFDLALGSGFFVENLKKDGELAEIDWSRVPNVKYIAPQFRHLPFDPEDKYSVALTWSAVGLAYNTTVFDKPPQSWKDLFEPSAEIRARTGGRVGLMNSPHRVFGAALITTGHSPNANDPASTDDAVKYLRRIAQSTQFKILPFDDLYNYLKTEEVVLAMAQSSDVTRIMTSNPDISFVIPQEGSWVGYDCTVIMKRQKETPGSKQSPATQREASLDFINFLLHPSVAAEISNFTMKASTEQASRPYLSPMIKHGPSQLSPKSGWMPLLADFSSPLQDQAFLELAPKPSKP